MAKRSKKLLEADRFRESVKALQRVRHSDWDDFQYEWLRNEARRREDYIYTEKERVILNRAIACATTFTSYSECSVQELLSAVYAFRGDLDEHNERWVQQLHQWGATELKVRQISRLAMLYRINEPLPIDKDVAEVMRATRADDDSEQIVQVLFSEDRPILGG
jgi:hypothetical protein